MKTRIVTALIGAGEVGGEVKDTVMAADPKNESGLYEKWLEGYQKTIRSKAQLADAVKALDAFAALDKVHDQAVWMKFTMNATFWNHKFLEDAEAAKKWAERARAAGAGEKNPRFKPLLDTILGS